jgi:hypothetical protein
MCNIFTKARAAFSATWRWFHREAFACLGLICSAFPSSKSAATGGAAKLPIERREGLPAPPQLNIVAAPLPPNR